MRHNHTSQYRDAIDYIATITEVEVEVEVEEEVKEKVEVELEVWRRRRTRRRSRKGGIKLALENSSTNSLRSLY